MIVIFTGLPGAGKSYKTAQTALDVLHRNKKWYERQVRERQYLIDRGEFDQDFNVEPVKLRKVYSNLKFAPAVEQEYQGFIEYWWDPSQLISIRNADVFWDEIATHLDSTQWANMSLEIKRWLQQHRKFGIDIYGTTQDFAMIDKSMRRMTSDLFYLSKLFGSSDKSATKPEVKHIWGLIMVKSLDPTTYDEDTKTSKGALPRFMMLTRSGVEVFDTTQEIKTGKYPPLNHIERECIKEGCQFHKIVHA